MRYKRDLVNVSNVSTREALVDIVKSEPEDCSTYVCNVNDLIYQYENWKKVMPRIEPHYAVKCNDSEIVLRTFAALGLGFDCASKSELQKVLKIGVDPSKIIFAHTIKLPSHIQYAVENNVRLMTFDNEYELEKMKKISAEIRAVIRIRYDSKTKVTLGIKFGCDAHTEAPYLLEVAKKKGINVVGVSFHIGSGTKDSSAFYHAIQAAHHVFKVAKSMGFDFYLLDIGGGFPGRTPEAICKVAEHVNAAISKWFSNPDVRIISEPGMYFVESAFKLACFIYGVQEGTVEDKRVYNYFINDGVFGNFGSAISYDMEIIPDSLHENKGERHPSVLRGPTSDPSDVIPNIYLLPKMICGEHMIFHYMGSYTSVIVTRFNGFGISHFYYLISKSNWDKIQNSKLPFPTNLCNLLCKKDK